MTGIVEIYDNFTAIREKEMAFCARDAMQDGTRIHVSKLFHEVLGWPYEKRVVLPAHLQSQGIGFRLTSEETGSEDAPSLLVLTPEADTVQGDLIESYLDEGFDFYLETDGQFFALAEANGDEDLVHFHLSDHDNPGREVLLQALQAGDIERLVSLLRDGPYAISHALRGLVKMHPEDFRALLKDGCDHIFEAAPSEVMAAITTLSEWIAYCVPIGSVDIGETAADAGSAEGASHEEAVFTSLEETVGHVFIPRMTGRSDRHFEIRVDGPKSFTLLAGSQIPMEGPVDKGTSHAVWDMVAQEGQSVPGKTAGGDACLVLSRDVTVTKPSFALTAALGYRSSPNLKLMEKESKAPFPALRQKRKADPVASPQTGREDFSEID